MDESRFDKGMRVRKEVLGETHVNRSMADPNAFNADFQQFITEVAWGSVWARPGLDRRTRSLVTIGVLAALGRTDELALHLRASKNAGATPDEVKEALMQVAAYAGIPAANTAFALAKVELFREEK
jgi:4-carboxymuconolactone decarboxylase